MAKFTIEIPENAMAEVVEAFCTAYNYEETIPDPDWEPVIKIKGKDRDQYPDPDRVSNPEPQEQIPNPETPRDFFLRQVESYIHGMYIAHRTHKAVAKAQEKVNDSPRIGLKTTLVK